MYVSTSTSSAPLWPPRSAANPNDADASRPTKSAIATSSNGKPLTDEQKQQIEKLKQRDSEVKRHEAAHLAVAGGAARSGPVYNYQTGPDGKQYAVGGHVDIDTSGVAGNPKATIAKMQQVQHAALAPADPSGQDRAVAAEAAASEQKARAEVAAEASPSGSDATKKTGDPKASKKAAKAAAFGASAAVQSGQLIDIAA